jgi:hypothetical protein
MSSWRVAQHYGFGAAQIPIRPEPHSSEMLGIMEGAVYLVGEIFAGGPVPTMRRLVGQAPAILLGLLLFMAFIVTLSRDRTDESPIEIVLFDSDEFIPESVPIALNPPNLPTPPIPEPIKIARPEPPKPVAPKPPSPQIAEIPKPVPAPAPVARPRPKAKARPRPVIPQIARVEAPSIPKPKRTERALRDRPEGAARPRIAIDVARPGPTASPEVPRMDRVARASVDRSVSPRPAPRMAAPAAPVFAERAAEPLQRSFRVASAKPVPGQRPRALPGLAPVPTSREAPPTPARNALRSKRSRPTAAPRTRRAAPALDRAAVPAAPVASVATRERAARPAPRLTPRRASRPVATMARESAATGSTASAATVVSRAGLSRPTTPRGKPNDRPGLAGVPLGDLAACLSDREEDRLKQAVVAAVTTQEECVSSKGTYRFIETKNLNAFLMWIDRAPARAASDRCVELGYALECLKGASQRAAR